MFVLADHTDKLQRKYKQVALSKLVDFDKNKTKGVHAMVLTHDKTFKDYCVAALKLQADKVHVLDKVGDDVSVLANELLSKIPKGVWVLVVDPDEVLYDLPKRYLKALAYFLEENKIYCGDFRFLDFVYNYGTLHACYDWGEGVCNYWVARKFFKWTGKERFIGKWHYNISNISNKKINELRQHHEVYGELPTGYENNEHTGQWRGTVVKCSDVVLFHYGKLDNVENLRKKNISFINKDAMAKGQIPTAPYYGPHPSVMKL